MAANKAGKQERKNRGTDAGAARNGRVSWLDKSARVKARAPEKAHGHELSELFLTTNAEQMDGVACDHAKLAVGKNAVVYARGI